MADRKEIDTFGRVPEYVELLKNAQAEGQCLLDPENFYTRQGNDVLQTYGGWILARTLYPYANTEQSRPGIEGHTLIFPEKHIVSPAEMTDEDILAREKLFRICAEIYGAKTGATFFRYSFDDNHVAAGATLAHLHMHVVTPHLDEDTGRVPGFNSANTKQIKLWVG